MSRATLAGALSGAVFAVGLWLSEMTDPAKVLGFLDVTGRWDPSLAWVMAGAVGAHFAWLRWTSRRAAISASKTALSAPSAPSVLSSPSPPVPASPPGVDRALLSGAAIFGVGWGMSGYCPGPALVALAWGRREAALFVLAMTCGVWLFNASRARARAPESLREPA